MTKECPFCAIGESIDHERIVAQSSHAFVVRDGFPVSSGHTLVIPKRHVGSFFELTEVERSQILSLLDEQRAALISELGVQDFNVGINDGPLAGQTVPHCHVHLIPRFEGDVADPRGGVRWLIPHKANYWD